VLFGVTTTQMYIYYSRFPDDSRGIKTLTAFVWLCEVVNTICLGVLLYTFTVSDYSHPELIIGSAVPVSLSIATLFSGFIAASVHGFFSFRIYTLNHSVLVPGLIWVVAFVLLLGRLTVVITSLRATSLGVYLAQYEWLLTTNWSVSVASDFVLTTTLVVVLLGRRSHAHKQTAALVDKLVAWTIETGMLTSVSSIIMLVLFITQKSTFLWIAAYAINTRLFSNTLMASLNSRVKLREMNQGSLGSHGMPSVTAAIGLPTNSMQMRRLAEEADVYGQKVPEHV